MQLVQKGILYMESELLVPANGEMVPVDEQTYKRNFTLVQALEVDKQKFPELVSKGRFALKDDLEVEELVRKESEEIEISDSPNASSTSKFIKTLSNTFALTQSSTSQWSPTSNCTIAWGELNSSAKIAQINDSSPEKWTIEESVELAHPADTQLENNNPIINVSWSPDGELLLTGVRSGELRLWNKHGKLKNILDHHKSPVVAIKWNEDCTHLLTTDVSNVVIVWSALTGTLLQYFDFKSDNTQQESLGIDLEWIGRDKFVIPGPAGSLLVFTIGNNKPLGRLLGHNSTISSLKFNASNKALLSASDDDSLRVWKGGNSSASNVFSGHLKTISSAHWVNDDLIISTDYDGVVKVWSISRNELIGEGSIDSEPIFEASLSPDKNWLAVGSLQGGVTVFNVKQLVETLKDIPASSKALNLLIYGEYQVDTEGLQVTNISWNDNSNVIAVSYIDGNTAILSL